ncbi:hypothetical protein E2C01_057163 [Portunus trituberculatus]|uniref:Uncharacterized protein n=1 Tax=Portunus trituberculatus TaxID=210409 RepID=A0A5B7GS98_PORTR|nr:hypothetical protein [Portunus trituberculatus]
MPPPPPPPPSFSTLSSSSSSSSTSSSSFLNGIHQRMYQESSVSTQHSQLPGNVEERPSSP